MEKTNLTETLCKVRQSSNLIHCITNPISINLLANAILALGCRPMMAEHPAEVAEITETASAVLLNTGNITDARMQSIKISAKEADANDIPAVLDIAGVSCSTLRHGFVSCLLKEHTFTLVKGNFSEIYSLAYVGHRSSGVDSAEPADIGTMEKVCTALAKKYGTIILATGKTDIVADGKSIIRISGGTPLLAKVTGTGCLVGAMCACFLSVERSAVSVAEACAFTGVCAELSENDKGTATFALQLLDNISTVTYEKLDELIRIEVKQHEEL